MGKSMSWWVAGSLLAGSFIMTLVRSPQEVNATLAPMAGQALPLSVTMHVILLAALGVGWLAPAKRTAVFAGLMALLAGSAAVMGIIFFIPPNAIIFGLYVVLILRGAKRGLLAWDFSRLTRLDWFFGLLGLVFGFWYLHWVEAPLWLNALLFSPLGVLNCPTVVTVSGLLCLASKRPPLLEFVTGMAALYFGFYGIMRLAAYVDVALILCGLYQLMRLAADLRPALAAKDHERVWAG